MKIPHTTISHSLIRGILFAAILCLLFTGTAGADDSPYLNINVPTTIFPEYPATAVFTFSSSGCTDLKVNYGDGTGEVELTAASQTVTHTYTQPGTYVVWLNATANGNQYSTSKEIVVKPYLSSGEIIITSTQNAYYLFEPFTVSGTNKYSNSVRLYIDGANFDFREITENAISVSDGQWSFIVDTSAICQTTPLDAGTYRLYAVVGEEIISFSELGDTKYSVIQIQLKRPTLTLTSPSNDITEGTSAVISGTARGTEKVQYYLFGVDKMITDTVSVGADHTFRIEIPTTGFPSGEYYAVIQHPMYDAEFNIYPQTNGENYDFYLKFHSPTNVPELLFSTSDYSATSAYMKLCDAFRSQNIDDIYEETNFLVTSSGDVNTGFITINSVSVDGSAGTIKISGTNTAGTYVYLYSLPTSGSSVCLTVNPITCENSRWETTVSLSSLTGSGTYEIYAVSSNIQSAPAVSEITNGKYAVHTLDQFITISISPEKVVEGEDVEISGTALGALVVQYFVFGTNYFDFGTVITNSDGKFVINLDYPISDSQRYSIIVQHPGKDTIFNIGAVLESEDHYIVMNPTNSYDTPGYTEIYGTTGRQHENLVEAICQLFTSSSIDDLYATTSFSFESASETPIPAAKFSLPITPGWNFISVPKYLDASCDTAGELFASLDTGGMSHLGYDAKTGWYTLKADTPIKPLEGYWVYSKNAKTIPLTYSADINVPPTKAVYQGWNAVGLSAEKPMTAKSAFANLNWVRCLPWDVVEGKWGTVIVKGGSAENSEELKLTLGSGNWLYVEADGTYTGNTA